MEVRVNGSPEEIQKLLQAIMSSEEQKVPEISLQIAGNEVGRVPLQRQLIFSALNSIL